MEGLDFDVVFSDVEQLNKWAFQDKLDITKLSFGAFSRCLSKYVFSEPRLESYESYVSCPAHLE